jgi:membrane-associated protease RseP (regulator of RpoE activity)
MPRTPRTAALAVLVLLAGCVSAPRAPVWQTQPSPPSSPYVADPGRDDATIAQMRAAPPAAPELVSGRNPAGDQNRLAAQGFVRIGTARYGGTDAEVRAEAERQGRAVGADRVLLYAPAATGATTVADWNVAFFVRFKLPFGATFRDLTAAERAQLGGDGVQIGSVVGGTPASRANLLAGDFVVQIDGKPVTGKNGFQDQLRALSGRQVTLTVVRNGETLQRAVRLGVVASPSAQ